MEFRHILINKTIVLADIVDDILVIAHNMCKVLKATGDEFTNVAKHSPLGVVIQTEKIGIKFDETR